MKKIILLFLSFLFLISCSEEKSSETVELDRNLPPHTLTINAVEFKKTDSTNTLLLETTLWNNTKDTLKYVSMSCAWSQVYSFSNPKVNITADPCTKNTPIVIFVEPETNAKTFFKVNLDGISEGSKEKVKLGIKLVKVKNDSEASGQVETLYDVKNTDKIIWSNEIEL